MQPTMRSVAGDADSGGAEQVAVAALRDGVGATPMKTLGLVGMSREGVVPTVLAVAGLCGGRALVLVFFRHYLDPDWRRASALFVGLLGVVLAGWMTTRLARRRDYPWLMFVATVALPLFQPQNKPDVLSWRLFSAVYGLVLVAVAVFALARMVSRTDELERRVNQEALAFAFTGTLVLAITYSLFRELLPELQGVWVAAVMIATWLVGWNLAWRRYR